MIEITHHQARRLIREAQDAPAGGQPLPEEQWSALQAHLETCGECRAYLERQKRFEKDLARTFSQRWKHVVEARAGQLTDRVVTDRRSVLRRNAVLRRLAPAVIGLLFLAAVILVGDDIFMRITQGSISATKTSRVYFSTANAAETAAVGAIRTADAPPPIRPNTFKGLVAFASSQAGKSEIYLLNVGPSGTDLTNLTQSPASDYAPAWSPDGEWLAFISDRSGKPDIYVTSIAGTRLSRLTADPDLEWKGGLSWSADGKWIAASAERRGQNHDTYFYLVPIDSHLSLRSVTYSREAHGNAVFSPTGSYLAFQPRYPAGWMYILDTLNGEYHPVNYDEVAYLGLRASGPFAWVYGAPRLIYQAEGPYNQDVAPQLLVEGRSELRLSADILTPDSANTSEWGGAIELGLNGYSSISIAPGTNITAAVHDSDRAGCRTLRIYQYDRPARQPDDVPGLCILGEVGKYSWVTRDAPDTETWLVVRGMVDGQDASMYYAVKIPDSLGDRSLQAADWTIEAISMFSDTPGDDRSEWPGEPQVRPELPSLGIRPYGYQIEKPSQAERWLELEEFDEPEARLAVVYRAEKAQSLAILAPDGSQVSRVIGPGAGCPALSPDRTRLAYMLPNLSGSGPVNEIFVTEVNSTMTVQLTSGDLISEIFPGTSDNLPRYECPIWSVDGRYLAAIYRDHLSAAYLAVIPVEDRNLETGYLQLEPIALQIAWPGMDNENGPIYVLNSSYFNRPPRVDLIDLTSTDNQAAFEEQGAAVDETFLEFDGYDAVAGFTLSPGAEDIAVILYDYRSDGRKLITRTILQVGKTSDGLASIEFAEFDPPQFNPRSLAWLAGDRLGILIPQTLNLPEKASLQIYDPRIYSVYTALTFTDMVTSAAWSADGKWAYFGSESGLYAVEISESLQEKASPVRIFAEWVSELDLQ